MLFENYRDWFLKQEKLEEEFGGKSTAPIAQSDFDSFSLTPKGRVGPAKP
jgi:hypothetical protein